MWPITLKLTSIYLKKKFIDQLYVPPGPGDESISIGAAFASMVEKEGFKNKFNRKKFPSNAYWGVPIDKMT